MQSEELSKCCPSTAELGFANAPLLACPRWPGWTLYLPSVLFPLPLWPIGDTAAHCLKPALTPPPAEKETEVHLFPRGQEVNVNDIIFSRELPN